MVLIITELRKLFYIFGAFHFTFLGHFILHFWANAWKNCGILLGKIVVNHMQFDIHKNLHFLRICGNFNTSKIAFGSAAERW